MKLTGSLTTDGTQTAPKHRRLKLWLIFASAVLLAACGSLEFRSGGRFDPAVLETRLVPDQSGSRQVRAVLGQPFGRGSAMMPYHDGPRTVWTYYFEEGSVDPGSGKLRDHRRYLFVFLNDDVYEGYMWFDSHLD